LYFFLLKSFAIDLTGKLIMSKKINLAILAPSLNAYSETFIQAHKTYINANTSYYYNGLIPQSLEGKGTINPILKKGFNKLTAHIKNDKFWAEKKALKDSLKKEKIEVVLAEYGNLAAEILPVCKELNLPLIVHFHGFDATVYEVLKKYNNYKELFDYTSKVIVVSKVMESQLIAIGCPKAKLVLNTYGPNDDFLTITPSLEKEQFIAVGRFTDKKAPYYTLLAFEKVVKKFPDAKLIMAGDGQLKNTCVNLVKYLQLENNVEFPGIITPTEFSSYLQKSRAFVQHSITADNGDMEGTPVAVLEASAAGIPVISTNHAGIPDVIIHNETGLLANEHDVESMANSMIAVLEDKNKAKAMGLASKERIKTFFTMSKHIDKLNELIYSVK